MADKKLTVVIASAISEVVKDKVVKDHAPNGAATIVRDANGRVTAVLISLPASASAAAAAALAATPGVAGVASSDIIPGTVGVDGTAKLTDAFTALGWSGGGSLDSETVQADGTVDEVLLPNGAATWDGPLFPAPIPGNAFDKSVEAKIKLADSSKDVRLVVMASDGGNDVKLVLRGGAGAGTGLAEVSYCAAPTPKLASVNINLGVAHTYRLQLPAGGGAPKLFIDGVEQSLSFATNGFFCNLPPTTFLSLGLQSNEADNQAVNVDFIRWTAPV